MITRRYDLRDTVWYPHHPPPPFQTCKRDRQHFQRAKENQGKINFKNRKPTHAHNNSLVCLLSRALLLIVSFLVWFRSRTIFLFFASLFLFVPYPIDRVVKNKPPARRFTQTLTEVKYSVAGHFQQQDIAVLTPFKSPKIPPYIISRKFVPQKGFQL